ncbi:hypothetical protein FOA52_001915 [Chlamydomonas sp. UWO 241]|nr:hypothetical protein FOA52_001915 [Chlamydomonas sp. UWO 241]
MTELDPFCALGGADGATALFRAVGGCWLRAASALVKGMRDGCYSSRLEDAIAQTETEVLEGAHLIAYNCAFSSECGAAVMLEEGSKATLHGCTIVSCGLYAGNGTGVTVMTGAQLAMYDCKAMTKKTKTETPAVAAGTSEISKDMQQLAPAPEMPAPTPELPPAVLAQIFSQLHAPFVGRAASVCSSWRGAASLEAVAWTLAMTDLDPFCALGGADGAAALFRAAGGCWLRVASILTRGMRMRDGEDTPCQCASPGCAATASVLCCCDPSAGMSGVKRRCSKHCSDPAHVACVKLKGGPLYNRWVFDPARVHKEAVYGDWTTTTSCDLEGAVSNCKAAETLHIDGSFKYKLSFGLHIVSPVRIMGKKDKMASFSQFDGFPLSVASLAMLENISYCLIDQECFCCCRNCSNFGGRGPAIKVRRGAHLIAHNCSFSSDSGAAVMLEEGSKATLHGCTIWSSGLYAGNGTGVTVKTGAQLAMYDCEVVNETFEFAFAREDTPAVLQLAGHNTFVNEAIKHPEESPEFNCYCEDELECQCEPVQLCGCENFGECKCDLLGSGDDDDDLFDRLDFSCRSDCLTCCCVRRWERRIATGPEKVEEYADTVVQPWRADWPCQTGHALAGSN